MTTRETLALTDQHRGGLQQIAAQLLGLGVTGQDVESVMEKALLSALMTHTRGHYHRAAASLCVHHVTLYKRLAEAGLVGTKHQHKKWTEKGRE